MSLKKSSGSPLQNQSVQYYRKSHLYVSSFRLKTEEPDLEKVISAIISSRKNYLLRIDQDDKFIHGFESFDKSKIASVRSNSIVGLIAFEVPPKSSKESLTEFRIRNEEPFYSEGSQNHNK